MPEIEITILRIVDGAFPGFVECRLIDAHGEEHTFVEKVPLVLADELSSSAVFPLRGHLSCEIESEQEDETSRVVVRVDATRPHGIESTSGRTRFDVLVSQLR